MTQPIPKDPADLPRFVDTKGNLFVQTHGGQYVYQGVYAPPKRETVADTALGAARGVARGALMPADAAAVPLQAGTLPATNPVAGRLLEMILARQGIDVPKLELQGGTPSNTLLNAAGVPKPDTGAGKYAEETAAGATGSLYFPGSKGLNMFSGGMSGAGGELAAETMGDSPTSRVSGALLGGLLSSPLAYAGRLGLSMLGGPSVKTAPMVADAAKGLSDDDWARANKTFTGARGAGVNITPIQAIDKETPLRQLQETVTTSPAAGHKLRPTLDAQNQQSADAARGMLGGVPVVEPAALARTAQGAATDAVKTAKAMRTDAVKQDYAMVLDPTKASVPGLRAGLETAIKQIGPTTEAGRFLDREVLSRIDPKASVVGNGEHIKTLLNEAKAKLGNPDYLNQLGVDKYAAANIRRGLRPLEDFIEVLSVNRPRGDARFAEISTSLVNPMKTGPLGQMAGTKGLIEDVPAATNRVLSTLNSDKIRAQSILNAQGWLSHESPGTFAQLVRQHLTARLEESFSAKAGAAAPDAPAKLAAALWGSAEQTGRRENFRAMLAGAAKDAGLDPTAVVRGGENLMRVLEAAGRAKGGMSQMQIQGGAADAGIARLGPGSANSVQVRFLTNFDQMLNGKAYKEIADILVSPDGMKQLRELANFDISKVRWGQASSAAAATVQQGQKGTEQK